MDKKQILVLTKCEICDKKRVISLYFLEKIIESNKKNICLLCALKLRTKRKRKPKMAELQDCFLIEKKNSRCEKNIFCKFYLNCLDYTSAHRWMGWKCVSEQKFYKIKKKLKIK